MPCRGLTLGFGVAALLAVATASAQTHVQPAKGVFLVAKPSIQGGPFHRSVVLLLEHGDDGTLGVIVNRSTEIPLAEAVPGLGDDAGSHSLYFGGPVGLQGLLFVYRRDEPPEDAAPVMTNVFYSGDHEVLEELVEDGKSEDELRLYLGHAGWAPGQLDDEIRRGSWNLVRADPFTLFVRDPETMWRDLNDKVRVVATASMLRSSRRGRPSSRNAPASAR